MDFAVATQISEGPVSEHLAGVSRKTSKNLHSEYVPYYFAFTPTGACKSAIVYVLCNVSKDFRPHETIFLAVPEVFPIHNTCPLENS